MLNNTFWGNTIETWLIAVGVSVGLLLAVKLIRDLLVRRFFRIEFAYPTRTVFLRGDTKHGNGESSHSDSIQPAYSAYT
jgi:hypothetical protein